jgi:PEP-CTERM motif
MVLKHQYHQESKLKKMAHHIALSLMAASCLLASSIATAATKHATFTSITGSPTVLDLSFTTNGPGTGWESITDLHGTYHSDLYELVYGVPTYHVRQLPAGSYGAGEDNLACLSQTCGDPYGPVTGRLVTQGGVVFSIGIPNQVWILGAGGANAPFEYSLGSNAGLMAPATFGSVVVSTVPEPESVALLVAGLGVLGIPRRRKSPGAD